MVGEREQIFKVKVLGTWIVGEMGYRGLKGGAVACGGQGYNSGKGFGRSEAASR